jgi:hypothetical protein
LAAPVVTGVLAALRSYKPDLSDEAAETLLLDTARTASAGKTLDAEAAFRSAGLGALVAPPSRLPAPRRTTHLPVPVASPGVPLARAATVEVVRASKPTDALTDLGVRRPRVRASTYRRGVLRIALSGVPDFARVIFTVGTQTYMRPSGTLRLRLTRAPKRVRVVIDVPGVGRTAPSTIKVKAARRR